MANVGSLWLQIGRQVEILESTCALDKCLKNLNEITDFKCSKGAQSEGTFVKETTFSEQYFWYNGVYSLSQSLNCSGFKGLTSFTLCELLCGVFPVLIFSHHRNKDKNSFSTFYLISENWKYLLFCCGCFYLRCYSTNF